MSKEKPPNQTNKMETEARLLSACQAQSIGWENELVLWLSGNGAWLEQRCAIRLGSSADAQDAMQEITLKVLRSVGQFEGRSSLLTWATRIADNYCSSFLKQRAAKAMTAHLQYSLALIEDDRFVHMDEPSSGTASVKTTLDALSTKNSEILRLRYFADLSLAEISRSLDISLSATKMRLYRAMDAFRIRYSIESY